MFRTPKRFCKGIKETVRLTADEDGFVTAIPYVFIVATIIQFLFIILYKALLFNLIPAIMYLIATVVFIRTAIKRVSKSQWISVKIRYFLPLSNVILYIGDEEHEKDVRIRLRGYV